MIRLFNVLILITTTFAWSNPGTMSTDDNPAAHAEASLSGYRTTPLDLPEKQEAQIRPMTMEDASSVEFDPDDPGVERIPVPSSATQGEKQ